MPEVPPSTCTVAEYLEYDLATHVAHLKPTTAANYRRAFRLWWTPVIGSVRLDALTLSCVQDALDNHRGNLAPSTVRMYAGLLSAAVSRAVLNRVIDRNPCVALAMPRMRPSTNKGLSQEETDRWIIAALAPAGRGGHFWYGPMLAIAPLTGLRNGELRGLRWDAVDIWPRPEGSTWGMLEVCEQIPHLSTVTEWDDPKSVASTREVPLDEDAARILNHHRQRVETFARRAGTRAWSEHRLVFPSRRGTVSATGAIAETRERVAALAMIDPTPTFHALRHTYASILVDAGMSPAQVAKLLGHSGVDLCIRQYYNPTPVAFDAAAAAMNKRRRPP